MDAFGGAGAEDEPAAEGAVGDGVAGDKEEAANMDERLFSKAGPREKGGGVPPSVGVAIDAALPESMMPAAEAALPG